MSNKKVTKKIATVCGALCLALSMLTTPIASLSVQAQEMVQPLSDKIEWRWKVENNKLYKRLFNYSTISWVGDWIYVCDVK